MTPHKTVVSLHLILGFVVFDSILALNRHYSLLYLKKCFDDSNGNDGTGGGDDDDYDGDDGKHSVLS